VQAHRDAQNWRGQHQDEQLTRSRFETEARRVAGLESELQNLRRRVETLAGEKSALQAEAERVPNLESRVTALGDEVSTLNAANAQLRTELQEHMQAHAEKIAILTKVRGEIEKDLKNVTADALRAN
jgi:DNA repair exonuclease SbcCD ATPase subunit